MERFGTLSYVGEPPRHLQKGEPVPRFRIEIETTYRESMYGPTTTSTRWEYYDIPDEAVRLVSEMADYDLDACAVILNNAGYWVSDHNENPTDMDGSQTDTAIEGEWL